MENFRELDQIRSDLTSLREKAQAQSTEFISRQAAYDEKFNQLMNHLEKLHSDLANVQESIRSLEILATRGKSSLETLLWVGGAISAITAFVLTLYNFIPK